MTRLNECLSIMKQLYDLGIDKNYQPLKELSRKLSDYVKTGEPSTFSIEMLRYGRVAHVTLPSDPQSRVHLTLKAMGHDADDNSS
jgi:hypothetical protein